MMCFICKLLQSGHLQSIIDIYCMKEKGKTLNRGYWFDGETMKVNILYLVLNSHARSCQSSECKNFDHHVVW